MALLPWLIIISCLTALPVAARLLLAMCASMAVAALLNAGLGNILVRDKFISAEWLSYERLLGYRFFSIRFPGTDARYFHSAVRRSLGEALLTFSLPTLAIALPAYPQLVAFNNWFGLHAQELQNMLAAINHLPVEDAVRTVHAHWIYYWFLRLMFQTALPSGMQPATFLLLLLATALFAVGFLSAVLALLRSPEARLISTSRVPMLDRISTLLNANCVPDQLRDKYRDDVLVLVKYHPFIHGPEGVPRMRTTCEALRWLDAKIPDKNRAAALAWIQACAAETGGYGYAPGQPPDPLHTQAAITTLAVRHLLSSEIGERHAAWLARQVQEYCSSDYSIQTPSELLAQLVLALDALSTLQRVAFVADRREVIRQLLARAWHDSPRDMSDSLHWLQALHILKLPQQEAVTTICDSALSRYEAQVVQLDPKNNLDLLHDMVLLCALIYPKIYRERPVIRQLADTLQKTRWDKVQRRV
jgi:hypothetical protein